MPPLRHRVVLGPDTLKQLTQGLRIGVLARQTAQQGQEIGVGVAAIECLAALVLGLGLFEPPGHIEIPLLVAGDKHRPRFKRHHLGLQLDRLIDAAHGEDHVDQRLGPFQGEGARLQDLPGNSFGFCPFLGAQQIVAALL